GGNAAEVSSPVVSLVGYIAAEQLIRAVAGESNCHMLAAEAGEEPDPDGARISARLIRMPRKILYRILQIYFRTDMELVVLSSIRRGPPPKIAALVATRGVERNRKRLQASWARLGRIMQDGR